MAVLCRPAVAVPEYVVTSEQTLDLVRTVHHGHPQLGLALRLIENTGVRKRHLVQPLEETLRHPGFEARNSLYEAEAKARVPGVVRRALETAGLSARDIDLIVYVSCTGFMMPSLTAWLINSMGFRPGTRQLPIAQLGCAAGGAAVNRAHDFCTAYPGSNALIVACEFCSLSYQPTDLGVGTLLSNGLFGDAVAAAVVRGEGGTGVRLERNASHLVPGTEDWIAYAVRDTGFHFLLDKRVPGTMEVLAPVLGEAARQHGWDVSGLDFHIVHAGGPRILDDLCTYLGVRPEAFRFSRATLTEYGNVASVVVLDALARLFDEGGLEQGAKGLIAGFGPGITAELALGHWTSPRVPALVGATAADGRAAAGAPTTASVPRARPGGPGSGTSGSSARTLTVAAPPAVAPASAADAAPDAGPVHFWAPPDLPGLTFDPLLARLLHEEPVSRVRLPHGEGHAWLVTRYEDVRFVSIDPRFSRRAVVGRSVTRLAPHFIPMDGAVGFADPPDHTRMRRVVARAFTSRSLARLRAHAQQVVDGLLDRMEERGGPLDLVAHLNRPFPLAMVCALLGVPRDEQPRMGEWTDTILSAARGREASEAAKAAMADSFRGLLARRAAEPRDDLAGALADAVGEDVLSTDEAVGLAVLIQIGGAHAVRNNSANMVYTLLTHPGHLARLRAEPALVPQAVEELLRYIPHRNAVGLSRIALEDVEVGGVLIPAGDPVYVSYLTANRDPDVFADPERLDFDRVHNPHVSFGHGPHYCPASALARMESEILLRTLWDRFPGLRLAVPQDELEWEKGALIRGPRQLPVMW